MSVATKLHSSAKPVSEHRAILGPAGNRVRVSQVVKRNTEVAKQPLRPRKPAQDMSESVVRSNTSVDSSASSDWSLSSNGSSTKNLASKKEVAKRNGGQKSLPVVTNSGEMVEVSQKSSGPFKRCDWITPNSDPLYISFHDEDWGVPVHDDQRLFELLVFSQALAELSWPAILIKRDIFRKLLDNFDAASIAQFPEKKLQSLKVDGNLILSEQKLRAIVENAKLVLKVQQEFGSLSNYLWRFVNHKAVKNSFRHVRQVPVKSPKAECISKHLMQRGFRCVGPTVIYSFMQASGMVNDHLVTCFRHRECSETVRADLKPKTDGAAALTNALENSHLSDS